MTEIKQSKKFHFTDEDVRLRTSNLATIVGLYCNALIGDGDRAYQVDISSVEDKNLLRVKIKVLNDACISLLFGPNKANMAGLLHLLRLQQLLPHNKYIEVVLISDEGSVQVVKDNQLFNATTKSPEDFWVMSGKTPLHRDSRPHSDAFKQKALVIDNLQTLDSGVKTVREGLKEALTSAPEKEIEVPRPKLRKKTI
jgi:hypothetical protein